MNSQEQRELVAMHWDMMKLLSMGVDERFLVGGGILPAQARDLLKGFCCICESGMDA